VMASLELEVPNLQSHYGFITALFKDHPWYSFELLQNAEYILTNLSNGRQIHFKQGDDDQVGLVTFRTESEEDFFERFDAITTLGGSISAEVKEIRPGHFSAWAKTPCGWSFGIAWSKDLV